MSVPNISVVAYLVMSKFVKYDQTDTPLHLTKTSWVARAFARLDNL
jgi:hypothetical protein